MEVPVFPMSTKLMKHNQNYSTRDQHKIKEGRKSKQIMNSETSITQNSLFLPSETQLTNNFPKRVYECTHNLKKKKKVFKKTVLLIRIQY